MSTGFTPWLWSANRAGNEGPGVGWTDRGAWLGYLGRTALQGAAGQKGLQDPRGHRDPLKGQKVGKGGEQVPRSGSLADRRDLQVSG